jgi:hypothetical protein
MPSIIDPKRRDQAPQLHHWAFSRAGLNKAIRIPQPWAAVCVEKMFTAREPKVTREPKINQTKSQVSLQRIPTERQENHVHFDGTLQVQEEAPPKRLSGPIGPRPTKAQLIASKSSR